MEQFDNKAVANAADSRAQVKASTMVQESRARQRNAWGGGSSVRKQLEVRILRAFVWICCVGKGPWFLCALHRPLFSIDGDGVGG